MSEEDLAARLRAVERAVTGEDASVLDLTDAAERDERIDDLEREVAALRERVDALDATVQSLHGYVGELEHVNDRVERRADAARAAVERLEGRHASTDPPGEPESDSRARDAADEESGPRRRRGDATGSDDLFADALGDGPGERAAAEESRRALLDRVRDAL